MGRTFDQNGPGEPYDSCTCFQDEHHTDCPAIVKGTCHYRDYYRLSYRSRENGYGYREIRTIFKSKEKKMQIDPLFRVHILNETGIAKARRIAAAFNDLLMVLNEVCVPGRERSLVYTKLEEAAFFAKKSMASQDENQVQYTPDSE